MKILIRFIDDKNNEELITTTKNHIILSILTCLYILSESHYIDGLFLSIIHLIFLTII